MVKMKSNPTAKVNKRSPKWYGWLPDLPDHWDFFYSAIAPEVARLPKQIDLQAKCSPRSQCEDVAEYIFVEKDNGASVQVRRGAKITIELSENPTTGYRWAISNIDEAFLVPEG